jgi:hypothetical protein
MGQTDGVLVCQWRGLERVSLTWIRGGIRMEQLASQVMGGTRRRQEGRTRRKKQAESRRR